jgi:hypothetical protein
MPPPGYYPQANPYGPYASPAQSLQDVQNLNLLSVLHFIYAGIFGLGGLFCAVYIVIGVMMATSVPSSGSAGGPPPEAIGGIFAAIGLIAMLFMWGKAALLIWSGISLRAHRRMMLSMIVAWLTCLNVPLGTLLGVFTIIVLNRPSVKAMYQEAELARV